MNLSKLFQMQKALDKRIVKEKGLEGVDLLPQKILALQVELGELANEWRGFKFWSNNQQSKQYLYDLITKKTPNPLLEEYVDCLHFILSIGIESDYDKYLLRKSNLSIVKNETITKQFVFLTTKVGTLLTFNSLPNYVHVIKNFKGLGEMLGFTWEQIEQAYIEKNAVNHERQENGY